MKRPDVTCIGPDGSNFVEKTIMPRDVVDAEIDAASEGLGTAVDSSCPFEHCCMRYNELVPRSEVLRYQFQFRRETSRYKRVIMTVLQVVSKTPVCGTNEFDLGALKLETLGDGVWMGIGVNRNANKPPRNSSNSFAVCERDPRSIAPDGWRNDLKPNKMFVFRLGL